jgi:hypothetical protein
MPTGTHGFYCKGLMELFEEQALDWLPARAAPQPAAPRGDLMKATISGFVLVFGRRDHGSLHTMR